MITNSISSFLNSFSSIGGLFRARTDSPSSPTVDSSGRIDRARGVEDSVHLSEEAQRTAGLQGKPTPEDEQVLRELSNRDREVRAHEAAHQAAGGSTTSGGPTYSYQIGPDGRRYAVGGEVPVQVTSSSDDPHERLQHAHEVARAALAPAEPSGADLAVAASARQEIAEAQREIREQAFEEKEREIEGEVEGDVQGAEQHRRGRSGNSLNSSSGKGSGYAPATRTGQLLNLVA